MQQPVYKSQAKKGTGSRTIKGFGQNQAQGRRSRISAKTQMPLCQYGLACTRKGCVYRHPKAKKGVGASATPPKKVCMAFLGGYCTYGKNCFNRHPPEAERAQLCKQFKQTPCAWGDRCRTDGCLYYHSWDDISGYDEAQGCVEVYENPDLNPQQWPTLGGAGSGLKSTDKNQTSPSSNTNNNIIGNRTIDNTILSYAAQSFQPTWGSASTSAGGTSLATAESGIAGLNLNANAFEWNTSNNNNTPIDNFTQGSTSVLTKLSITQDVGSVVPAFVDPTLVPQHWPKLSNTASATTEAAAASSSRGSSAVWGGNQQETMKQEYSSSAEAMAARAAEAVLGSITMKPRAISSNTNSNRVGGQSSRTRKHIDIIPIPQEIWRSGGGTYNPALFSAIKDPIRRFADVNKSSKPGIVDLHFQTVKSVVEVLDFIMPQYQGFQSEWNGIWVITGTGHHRGGHQSEGKLFATVLQYLEERMYSFKLGKDANGFKGAFLIKI